jgi:uncharacterized protein (DUF2147 family)
LSPFIDDHRAALEELCRRYHVRSLFLVGSAARDDFDPASGSWAATGNMQTPRGGEGVTLLPDGKVLVEGGAGGGSVGIASAELYDPASGAWAATVRPVMGSQEATATLLPDGSVLVAGGFGAGGPLASAELYSPGSGR